MAKYVKCLRDFLDPYSGVIFVRGQCFSHKDEANAEFHVLMGTLEYAEMPEADPEPEPESDPDPEYAAESDHGEVFDVPAAKKKGK